MTGIPFTISRRARVASLAIVLPGIVIAGAPVATDFEDVSVVAIGDILPAALVRSADYDIEPEVRATGNFYRFTVHSDFGTYTVTSRAMLRRRLHELTVLAELAPRLQAADIALERAPEGRRGVGSEHVVDILANPIGTATELLGNLQYNVEATFVGTDETTAPSPISTGSIDLNPGPHKRSAAAQLGVDVYSSNPRLQALLATLAKARSAGSSLPAFSPLVHNRFADARFGSGALDQRLESILKNNGAHELNARLVDDLDSLGVPERDRVAFLTHPAYTPRTRLYFTSYVQLLGPVQRLARLFHAANSAQTEADAVAYVQYARMLAFYQVNIGGLARVVTATRFPTLATADREGVLALPLDYLAWSSEAAVAADRVERIREEQTLERFMVLLAGTATPRARDELEARAIALKAAFSY